jgi:hypothetical protein
MRKGWLAVGGTVAALLVAEAVCRMRFEDPFEGLGESRNSWRVVGLMPDPELEFSFEPGYEGRMTLARAPRASCSSGTASSSASASS